MMNIMKRFLMAVFTLSGLCLLYDRTESGDKDPQLYPASGESLHGCGRC